MRKRALLIGSQTGELAGVHADVESMCDALKPFGFECTALIEERPTLAGIREAYHALIDDTAAGDAALVYYSGHGARLPAPPGGQADPRWLQYLVPVGSPAGPDAAFHGLLAEEISQLQAALTARTDNVTTILDCCHAARMSRGADLLPKARPHTADLPWPAIRATWQRLRDAPLAGAVRADSNEHAVRLVACAPAESAYELPRFFGGPHGALTLALTGVLRRPGSHELSWRELLGLVRPAVHDLVISQRPEAEGPIDRRLFDTARKSGTGVLDVLVEHGCAYLEHPELFGVEEGDTYSLTEIGAASSAPLAVATVDWVSGGRARLRLDGANNAAALPTRLSAWPIDVALGRRPVAVVPAGHPSRERVVAAIGGPSQVRVAGPGDLPIATVRLDRDEFRLLDAGGEPLAGHPHPITDGELRGLRADLRQLARASHVRELDPGVGPAALDDAVTAAYTLLRDGAERPLDPCGAHLFADDEIVIRLHNGAPSRRYVSVLDIGLRGAVTLLTTSEPAGISIEPGDSHELYRLPGTGELAGIELYWPPNLPAGGPRPETVLVVTTDRPQDLRALGQGGVRGDRPGPAELLRLLNDALAGRRDGRPPKAATVALRYHVQRFHFYLHPRRRT